MSKRKEIEDLKKEMFSNYNLVKSNSNLSNEENSTENKIEKYNPLHFYKVIGQRKLLMTSDHTKISNKAAYFLENILTQEKMIRENNIKNNKELENDSNHLQLRDIHNSAAIKTKLNTFILIYFCPLIFVTKFSKLNQMGYMRFLFLIPFIAAYPHINEGIKHYTTRKEAIPMLYCMEKYYKNEKDLEFYNLYRKFMNDNNLEFKEINNIQK